MEKHELLFWLSLLDWGYRLNIIFLVVSFVIMLINLLLGGFVAELIRLRIFRSLRFFFIDLFVLIFLYSVLGHYLLGISVEFLLNRYLIYGYKLLPELYTELIAPVFKVLFGLAT